MLKCKCSLWELLLTESLVIFGNKIGELDPAIHQHNMWAVIGLFYIPLTPAFLFTPFPVPTFAFQLSQLLLHGGPKALGVNFPRAGKDCWEQGRGMKKACRPCVHRLLDPTHCSEQLFPDSALSRLPPSCRWVVGPGRKGGGSVADFEFTSS